MKKIRARFKEMKEGFLTGKGEKAFHAYMFANYILIYLVFVIMCIISIIISNTFGIYMLAISLIFIIKNNCVYDTNLRRHYDFDEYIKLNNAEIYKIFDKKEYCKTSFFDDIYEDFAKWCSERNVHCDPQRTPTLN